MNSESGSGDLSLAPRSRAAQERAHWLADEHGLTHGYASAIVHEYEVQRRLRRSALTWIPQRAREFLRAHHHAVLATISEPTDGRSCPR